MRQQGSSCTARLEERGNDFLQFGINARRFDLEAGIPYLERVASADEVGKVANLRPVAQHGRHDKPTAGIEREVFDKAKGPAIGVVAAVITPGIGFPVFRAIKPRMEQLRPSMIIADQTGIAFMFGNNEIASVAVRFDGLAQSCRDGDAGFRVNRVQRAPPVQCPTAHANSRPNPARAQPSWLRNQSLPTRMTTMNPGQPRPLNAQGYQWQLGDTTGFYG